MDAEYAEKLERFMNEAEVITNFLRQQIEQKIIHQSLYVGNIKRFITAYEELKTHTKD